MLKTLSALAVLTLVTHLPAILVGIGLINADTSVFALIADDLRNGVWQTFLYQQNYGGLTLTVLRALWTAAWDSCFPGPQAHVMGHSAFTFGVVPVLLTWSAYYFAKGLLTANAALLVGFLVAIGHHYIVATGFVHGNEFYAAYLIIGLVLLGIRVRVKDLWLDYSPLKLFLVAVLSGLAFYTHRASLIFTMSIFLPWDLLVNSVKRLCVPQDKMERYAIRLIVFFIGLYLYLKIWGEDVGTIFGKHIRLHSSPNLKIAFVLATLVSIKAFWKKTNRALIHKFILVALGFCLGMLPEFIFWLKQGQLPPLGANAGTGGEYSLTDVGSILAMIPINLGKMSYGDDGIGRNASLLLLIFALVAFHRKSWRDSRYKSIILTTILTIWIYCSVYTYLFAPSRYLLPLFAALFAGYGACFDLAKTKRAKTTVLILCALHATHQMGSRFRTANQIRESKKIEQMWEVVSTFKTAEVPVVIAYDFWQANQYMVLSQKAPYFISTGREWGPPKGFELGHTAKEVGVILANAPADNTLSNYYGRNWQLSYLKQVGALHLYRATAKN